MYVNKKHFDFQLLQQKKTSLSPVQVPGSRALNSGSPSGQITQTLLSQSESPSWPKAVNFMTFNQRTSVVRWFQKLVMSQSSSSLYFTTGKVASETYVITKKLRKIQFPYQWTDMDNWVVPAFRLHISPVSRWMSPSRINSLKIFRTVLHFICSFGTKARHKLNVQWNPAQGDQD